jgi:hypothetical protein
VTKDEATNKLIYDLNSIVGHSFGDRKTKDGKTKKIVLLIDEAHILVMAESKGILYDALHWWLRETRSDGLRLVAVFAGTRLALANYQPFGPRLACS